MKKYPKKPFLIAGHRYEQLWLVIPLCIFLAFCKGCGIIGSILVLIFWFYYSIQVSEQEWRKECDKGIASVHCPDGYLEKQGFIENHGLNTVEIPKVVITQEVIDQYIKEIEIKKKILEEMIIDNHNYKILSTRWRWHIYKTQFDDSIEQEYIDIYHQIKNKTFKYTNDKAYEYFNSTINGYRIGDETPYLYAAAIYIDVLINEMEITQRELYRKIMRIYGCEFAVLDSDKAYEKIMKGENIYEE